MAGERILIVEDEAILAAGLQSLLEGNGYSVEATVATGPDAIHVADEIRPDLILMDIRLQGDMDGIDAARIIRERSDIPILYLTAYADGETLARAEATAPFAYVLKPYQDREVTAAVKMALYRHGCEKTVRDALAKTEQANEALDYQKRFFETLFNTTPSCLLVLDRGHRIRAVNPEMELVLGRSKEDLISKLMGKELGCASAMGAAGKSCWPACEHKCGLHLAIEEAFEGKKVRRRKAEMSLAHGEGMRQVEFLVSTSSIHFEREDLCVVALEDVTELGNLRLLVKAQQPVEGIVGQDKTMVELLEAIREVADSKVPVLIQGQSGTGKDLVASAIHNLSPWSDRPFVPVNCGALPEGLLESELFGHVKGAFTGAVKDKKGRFQLADGGTLFLDEVGELGPQVQVKLLRVLQNGTFQRVGGEDTIHVDVRVICATNRDLKRDVASGRFREDLYYRLAVVPITVPPLSSRRADIPLLAAHFISATSREKGVDCAGISSEAMTILMDQPWEGNVRELSNVLQYAFIKARGGTIRVEHLPPSMRSAPKPLERTLIRKEKLDEDKVIETLRQCNGNKVRAAKLLGVSRSTLYRFFEERLGQEDSAV